MRFKFTLFLLALNVIALGLIVFLGQRANRADASTSGLAAMIGREVIDADRIELRGQRLDATRVLTRKGASWSITQPMQWSANYFAVNRILNQLQFLEEEASFSVDEIESTGQTLADYGLEDPFLTLTIGRENEAVVLSIGKPTDIGNNVYLLGPNQRDIFVVNRQVVDSLLVELGDLRTREIFDIPVFEVEALSLQIRTPESAGVGDLKVRLARSSGKGWIFEAPLAAEADPALVSNTINTLTAAKVVEFSEESAPSLADRGLDTPSMQVTLHGNKRRQTLLLGNRREGNRGEVLYHAKLEHNPTVFTVAAKPFDELREAQEALRERNFMTFDRGAVTEINISEKNRQIRLQKLETGGWQVIQSDAAADIQPLRADPTIMDQLLEDLRKLRASGFAIDAPDQAELERLGFNEPRRTVTLSMAGGDRTTTLLLAHPEDENERLYARSNRAEYIYLVERQPTLRMLPLNALHYRNRTLDTLPEAARITSFKLEDLATGTVLFDQSLGAPEARWENVLADLPEAERNARLTLLDSVRRFTVRTYLSDAFDETGYQLDEEKILPWKYRLTARISLPGGETVREDARTYLFTERRSGTNQTGGSRNQNSVFQISQNTLDALYILTETMELPPEATGDPMPEPATVQPVPEPEVP